MLLLLDQYTLLLTQLSFLFILSVFIFRQLWEGYRKYAVFSYLFFSFIFITQPWKKTTQKTLRPLRSLVRISTARADAHNTIAPLPTFKLRLQKINNPVWKKNLSLYNPAFLMYPALF